MKRGDTSAIASFAFRDQNDSLIIQNLNLMTASQGDLGARAVSMKRKQSEHHHASGGMANDNHHKTGRFYSVVEGGSPKD